MKFLIFVVSTILIAVNVKAEIHDGDLPYNEAKLESKLRENAPHFKEALAFLNNDLIMKSVQNHLQLKDKLFSDILKVSKRHLKEAIDDKKVDIKKFLNDPEVQKIKKEIKPEEAKAIVEMTKKMFGEFN